MLWGLKSICLIFGAKSLLTYIKNFGSARGREGYLVLSFNFDSITWLSMCAAKKVIASLRT